MNREERKRKMKEKLIQKLERDGVDYTIGAKGEGKLIVIEDGKVLGELGSPLPQEEIISILVRSSQESEVEPILSEDILVENFYTMLISDSGSIEEIGLFDQHVTSSLEIKIEHPSKM
ncbi:hypothetical protein, partial [Exiguobacterium sp. SH31]